MKLKELSKNNFHCFDSEMHQDTYLLCNEECNEECNDNADDLKRYIVNIVDHYQVKGFSKNLSI